MQNTIRYALFLLIVSGVLFTACESDVQDADMELPTNEEVEEETGIDTDLDEESGIYEDGSYTATGSYASPAGPESVAVTLTVENDVVTGVSVVKNATNATSKQFQELFASGISAQVVGKSLDEIGDYSSVNGSSLTPNGFDSALASIKADAAL